MKTLFVILAITGILLQGMNKAIILIGFRLNQGYIAKNICIQKEVKNNCCKGKCFLTKELKADDEKEGLPGAANFKFKSESELFIQSFLFPVFTRSYLSFDFSSHYTLNLTTPFISSVYHPPC